MPIEPPEKQLFEAACGYAELGMYRDADEELEKAQRLRELGDKFFGYVKKMWPALNSYTHSGALQIGRRFTGDQVKANYNEADIAQALTVATTGLLLLLHMFFVSTEHYEEVDEIHTMLASYRFDFSERLQAAQRLITVL